MITEIFPRDHIDPINYQFLWGDLKSWVLLFSFGFQLAIVSINSEMKRREKKTKIESIP